MNETIKPMLDSPLIRTMSDETWMGMTVAAYREYCALPETEAARGMFGNVWTVSQFSEHWSTPSEHRFPERLYTEDSVRGLLELYEEEIAQLKSQLAEKK